MAKDEVKGRVEGVVKGFKVVKKRYYSDQGVEMDVEVPLSGIAQAVLEPATAPVQAVPAKAPRAVHGLWSTPAGWSAAGARAALLDASGKVLYSAETMGADARKDAVPARYFKSLEQATNATGLGGSPLLVKAQKAQGADLILADAEARALDQLSSKALVEGRVAIVHEECTSRRGAAPDPGPDPAWAAEKVPAVVTKEAEGEAAIVGGKRRSRGPRGEGGGAAERGGAGGRRAGQRAVAGGQQPAGLRPGVLAQRGYVRSYEVLSQTTERNVVKVKVRARWARPSWIATSRRCRRW
jgi:hypothetical protein